VFRYKKPSFRTKPGRQRIPLRPSGASTPFCILGPLLGFRSWCSVLGSRKDRSWGNSGWTPDDELSLEAGTRRDFTDLSIFDYVAAQILLGGLQHRPAQVLAIDVKSGKWF
jgi:hypothetical protein